jgi:uncharacterized protein with PIN domain
LRFVVDGMLGKLTRWLRLLGHDVEYSNNMEDKDLIGIAKKEKMVLLTRDFQLYQQAVGKGLDAFYVEGQTEPERLAEISKRFSIRLEVDMKISRCSKCNTIVKPILKEKIADKVEKNTLAHYDEFWMCPKCEQVYWQGAHWTRIGKILEKAQELLRTKS